MKKILCLTLALIFLIGLPVQGLAKEVEIYLDGKKVQTDTAPFLKNNRTLVPIRFISENLGYKVDWIQEEKRVLIQGDKTIGLTIDRPLMTVDENSLKLDISPMIYNNRTMVPLRAISEAFGIAVGWDQDNYRVILETGRLTQLNEVENIYFQSLKEGQRNYMANFRQMQEILTRHMASLSRDQLLSELDRIQADLEGEISRIRAINPPQKFIPIQDLYLKTLAQTPSMVEAYKKAYLENDQTAAKDLVSQFFYLNLQASELESAMEAIEKGEDYSISQEYQDFNRMVNQGENNIFSDDIIKNLLRQI